MLALDNGPAHAGKASLAALDPRFSWFMAEWLPRHAPELNPIENAWPGLKRHCLAHRTFRVAPELDQAIPP